MIDQELKISYTVRYEYCGDMSACYGAYITFRLPAVGDVLHPLLIPLDTIQVLDEDLHPEWGNTEASCPQQRLDHMYINSGESWAALDKQIKAIVAETLDKLKFVVAANRTRAAGMPEETYTTITL